MSLPVADPWYRAERLDARTTRITEPHVHPVFSANMHLVTGCSADLLIDSGMGIAPLRPFVDALRPDPARPLILLCTHSHVDHIGAAHEFDIRLAHPEEAAALADPGPYTLVSADIPDHLRDLFLDAGYPPLWPLLIDAVPAEGYAIADYALHGAPATRIVQHGDRIDLGDWVGEVLHMPGHSPGQVGLWHADSGTLFGADAIYDGPLIFDGPGMSVADYTRTLTRIRDLPVTVVHGGHDPAFGPARRDAIAAHYLALWQGR